MGRLGLAVGLVVASVVMWASPAQAQDNQNCGDFPSQAAAQQHLREDPSDPDGLDGDNDGVACQSFDYPAGSPRDETPVDRSGGQATTTTTAALPVAPQLTQTPADDQDCRDFSSQAAAQAHLAEDPSDPDRLDTDHDGQACEVFFAPRAAVKAKTTSRRAAAARQPLANTGSSHAVLLTLLAAGLLGVGVVLNEVGPVRYRRSRAATVAFHRLDDVLDEALR